MRIVIATTTGFHLRHLARELITLDHDVTFISILPKWKTRSYGLPDSACISLFTRLQPWATLALLRRSWGWLRRVRDELAVRTDHAITHVLPTCDVFIGLSSITVDSAVAAREAGARVLIERGATHIDTQVAAALAAGAEPPSALYVSRENASYAVADLIVVPSRFVERTFAEASDKPKTVCVIPLGVDTASFAMPAAPAALPVSAIFVGGWTRRKGCDQFAPLLDALPALHLTHIGLPGDVPFPASDRFSTLGYLTALALGAELPKHHLFLFPSRDDGFGMVMGEALACGLRVVASSASGAPDLQAIVGDDLVTVIPPSDFAALRDATREQMAVIERDPAGARPTPTQRERLSWQHYGEAFAAMLAGARV